MLATIVIGVLFLAIIFFAGKKALADLRKGKCSGCSSCSGSKTCSLKDDVTQIKM